MVGPVTSSCGSGAAPQAASNAHAAAADQRASPAPRFALILEEEIRPPMNANERK
jgi:hypothetical protein